MSKSVQKSRFAIAGRFVRFAVEDGFKIKGFYLTAAGVGEVYIKVPKRLRYYCADLLVPGAFLQVRGQKKVDLKRERFKLKAEEILSATAVYERASGQQLATGNLNFDAEAAIAIASTTVTPTATPPTATPQSKPQCIRICQKSSCRKRGGAALWQALEAGLKEAGLSDRVTLKATGCMGKCKAGPNLIMPGKMRYGRIPVEAVPGLLEEHFTSPSTH